MSGDVILEAQGLVKHESILGRGSCAGRGAA